MILIRSGGLPLSAWEPLRTGPPSVGALREKAEQAAAQVLGAFDATLASLAESPLRTAVYNARKAFFQHRKQPQGDTAALLASLPELNEKLALFQQHLDETTREAARFEEGLLQNYRYLQSLAAEREGSLCRALLFASHDLLASLPGLAQKPPENWGKKERRSAQSLLQYLARAVFKTSPLSRFTTVQARRLGMGEAETEGFDLGEKHLVSPHVAILSGLYETLLREPAFYRSLQLRLNPSAQTGESGSLTWLYFDGEREAIQEAAHDPLLQWLFDTLMATDRQQMPFPALLEVLADAVDAPERDLEALIFRWADSGLLEWCWPEKGFSPAWAGALYQYLGHLPASPDLSEAAYLLQWLRTAGRSLPFLSTDEAMRLQHEAAGQVHSFFQKHRTPLPPIRPEQVFWEDVAADRDAALPKGVAEKWAEQLATCWHERAAGRNSPFKQRLLAFAAQTLAPEQTLDFLAFCRAFLENSAKKSTAPLHFSQPAQRMGALLQWFEEGGETKSVVNALYHGGGKMWARWLPLFPARVGDAWSEWWQPTGSSLCLQFPWQSWSNANFQPQWAASALLVPGDRGAGGGIPLRSLGVRRDHHGGVCLVDKASGQPVVLSDLGLEAPEGRPPAMQVLWHLGQPFVSADALLPEPAWETGEGCRLRHRVTYGNLVLARASWELHEGWGRRFLPAAGTRAERIGTVVERLKALGVPVRFFARPKQRRAKPQYVDMECPLSMLLFEKILMGDSVLEVVEMLPMPEQCPSGRAAEVVLEWAPGEGG